MAVDFNHMPMGHPKTLCHIFANRKRRAPIIGNLIVIPQQDQLAKCKVACQRNHLLANTFLQATITNKRIGMVID